MTFDKTTFTSRATEILSAIATGCYAFLEGPGARGDIWTEIRMNSRLALGFDLYAPKLNTGAEKSNHRLLAEVAFEADRKAEAEAFRDLLLDAVPALDHQFFSIELEVRDPSKSGNPRFRLQICGEQMTSNPVQLGTMVEKLATLAQRLRDTPKPDTRIFMVNERQVPAVDAYAAVRVYSALAFPHIFTNPPALTPAIMVSEKLNAGPLFDPIYREAEEPA